MIFEKSIIYFLGAPNENGDEKLDETGCAKEKVDDWN